MRGTGPGSGRHGAQGGWDTPTNRVQGGIYTTVYTPYHPGRHIGRDTPPYPPRRHIERF